MAKINNSFDGLNSLANIKDEYSKLRSRAADSYIRNLHSYRVEIELAFLPVTNYLLASKEKITLPDEFESLRDYLFQISKMYHKRNFNFETSSKAGGFKDDWLLLANVINWARKSYDYCLNDLIDLRFDTGFKYAGLNLPKSIIYMSNRVRKNYHKHFPTEFSETLENFESMESLSLTSEDDIKAKSLCSTPTVLYRKVVEEIVEKAIDFSTLQLYDFLYEEGNKTSKELIIKSTKLKKIWDEVLYLGSIERGKASLPKNILVKAYQNIDLNTDEGKFCRIMEEWAANINRALELKLLVGVEFVQYLNTHKESPVYFNFKQKEYPVLNGLVDYVSRRIALGSVNETIIYP